MNRPARPLLAIVLIGLPLYFSQSASAQNQNATSLVQTGGGMKNDGDFFRSGEVQLNLFGIGGTGQGVRDAINTYTQDRTVSVKKAILVYNADESIKLAAPVYDHETITVETTRGMKAHRNINTAPIQGAFGGAGTEATYFITRNIGAGLDGDWMDGQSSTGTIMASLTARFPMGSNAPYLFGAAGVQVDDETKAVGKLGAGIEHRFSPHTGLFVDAAWMFSDHENAAVFRAGISLIY